MVTLSLRKTETLENTNARLRRSEREAIGYAKKLVEKDTLLEAAARRDQKKDELLEAAARREQNQARRLRKMEAQIEQAEAQVKNRLSVKLKKYVADKEADSRAQHIKDKKQESKNKHKAVEDARESLTKQHELELNQQREKYDLELERQREKSTSYLKTLTRSFLSLPRRWTVAFSEKHGKPLFADEDGTRYSSVPRKDEQEDDNRSKKRRRHY